MKTRKTNKAKTLDSRCRNNGTCPHCLGNRLAQVKRAVPADLLIQMRSANENEEER